MSKRSLSTFSAGLLAAAALVAGVVVTPAGADPTALGATARDNRSVVDEDFSGSALPAGFTAVEGTWQVKNGRLYGASADAGQQSRITFGEHLDDFRIEATARFESVNGAARWTAMVLDVPADGAVPWQIATLRSGTTVPNGLEFAQRTTADAWNVTDTAAAPSAAGTGRIRDLTSAQLNALDAGSWFAAAYAGARVPTLAAQLADLRSRGGDLLLEIKGAHTRDEVATIVKTVRDHGMTGRVFVQSFEVSALQYTHELAPELPLGLLRDSLDADPVAVAGELHLSAYNPSDGALSKDPGVVKDLHAAGVAVNVWTVDSAARWQALEAAGVDGIITNRPAELSGWNAAWLQRRQATPDAPAVSLASPAANARLDRAQTPFVAVRSTGADQVALSLDGAPVAAGQSLDLAVLTADEHALRAEATGPGGTTTATSVFTVTASRTGPAQLILTSGAEDRVVSTMTGMLGRGHCAQLATWARKQAGKAGLSAGRGALIAAEATALA
ncbi:glycerophosphodiester phosphodiesterase [Streptomyces sp. NPDC056161]|uniref:glycerophosphodiester phosphodiesterase n=1 Tax=Streptomyces sp. NPDC056161 TaxID=3345732 RepID=UPI0035DA1635